MLQPTNKKIILNPLISIWAIVQLAIVFYYGIYSEQEALKYISEADYLLKNGHFSEPKYLFYASYILLHLFMKIIGAGTIGVYLTQLSLNALATHFFYKLTLEYTNKYAANISTLLLIIFIPYQAWTAHLYTESLFCSCIVFLCYSFLSKNLSWKKKAISVPLLLMLTILSRPTGLLFIPIIFFAFLLSTRHIKLSYKCLLAMIVTILFVAILQYAMYGKGEFNFLKPFVQEHIICGMPTNNIAFIENDKADNALPALWQFISNHTTTFLKLIGKRLIAFWGLYRTYFSWKHNLMLAFFFYPVYFLFVAGLKSQFANSRMVFYTSLLTIFIFSVSIVITCDDWHNRFIMPLVPILLLGTAFTVKKIYKE